MLCIRGKLICFRRVSVRLSVTSRCSTKTAKSRITHTTPYDSSGSLRVGGREGMKGLGALQRHQLPHPLAKILDPPLNCITVIIERSDHSLVTYWGLNFCWWLFTTFWYIISKKRKMSCFLKSEKKTKNTYSRTLTRMLIVVYEKKLLCHLS